jgi:hypothetical protein
MAGFWSLIALLKQLADAIASLLGYIAASQHQSVVKQIDEATKAAGDPAKTDDEREAARKKLEDLINRHT